MNIERSILLQGLWKYYQVEIQRIPNTLHLSKSQRDIVEHEWKNKPQDAQDLPLWRFEGYNVQNDLLRLQVSLCSYKWHFILRNQTYTERRHYPNPTSATTLMQTKDKRLVLGIRKGSDQGNLLHAVGGGFIDPIPNEGENLRSKNFRPENPLIASAREIVEETTVNRNDFELTDFSMLGLVWGSNHDTTCVVHAPIQINSEDIEINAPEHSELLFLDVKSSKIKAIISNGFLGGRAESPATDHLVLALELFLTKNGND